MKSKPITVLLSAAMSAVLLLCACGTPREASSARQNNKSSVSPAKSGVVARNGNYQLLWDNSIGALFLVARSGKVWSSVPYGLYNSKSIKPEKYESFPPVTVTYIDPDTNGLKTIQASSGNSGDTRFVASGIDNGIRVDYHFDQPEISVSVEYLLKNDGMEARIPIADLREAENKIYRISVLPFISSVPNDSDSYLFVPSGSGALISAETKNEPRYYGEPVYGEDMARTVLYNDTETNGIRLPVFGVSDCGNALLGIIEQAAESAFVEAQAGNSELGISSVYATFQVRGEEDIEFKNVDNVETKIQVFSQNKISCKYASVKYVPVLSDKKGIIGMAEAYRNYLISKGMKPSAQSESVLYMTVLGGATAESSFFGIPYRTLRPTTTLKQAEDIITEISGFACGRPITVNLMGFGAGGTDPSGVGGGFKISGKLGSGKEMKRLCGSLKDMGNSVYLDFDLIRFNKSGGGFSVWRDTAKSANSATAKKTDYLYSTSGRDLSYPSWYLLCRGRLPDAGAKLLKAADKLGIDGVSAATLSSYAYSDGKNASYAVKGNMAKDVSGIIKSVRKSGKSFLGVAPNAYAAMYSDCILAPPSHSGEWDCISEDVPFYQIVFKGVIPLSSASVNLSANMRTEILRGISVGAAPAFTVYSTYESSLRRESGGVYMAGEYSALSSVISEVAAETADFLSQVGGASIISFRREGEVTETVFSNGVAVYVNFSNKSADTPLGSVEAKQFIYGRVNVQ